MTKITLWIRPFCITSSFTFDTLRTFYFYLELSVFILLYFLHHCVFGRRCSQIPEALPIPGNKALTDYSPDEGKQQRKQGVGPVPLVLTRYGDDTQEEEDERFGDGGQHLDNVANGCAGSLGYILLHVELHGYGTCYNAGGRGGKKWSLLWLRLKPCKHTFPWEVKGMICHFLCQLELSAGR